MAVEAIAESFCRVDSRAELERLLQSRRPDLIISGGSNILFAEPRVRGLTLQLNLRGIEAQDYDRDHVLVTAAAGEDWHGFTQWCVARDYGGLENLSLIPGNVGAAPIQNIGAYGVELGDVLFAVEAIDLESHDTRLLRTADCAFAYRDSLFKTAQRGRWIIVAAQFLLTKKHHRLRRDYGAIDAVLRQRGIRRPGIRDITDAVIHIRRQRLPDPLLSPNAGSFFKNPLLDAGRYDTLRGNHPDMPAYPQADGRVKLAAAWLIEQCGWKGRRLNRCGVDDKHALVIVNHGGASGAEILGLAAAIADSVGERFSIDLQHEVNVVRG